MIDELQGTAPSADNLSEAQAVQIESPDLYWKAFSQAHPGHPTLELETIYALPLDLIESITKEVPDFFSKEDETFERDLTKFSGGGFFLKRPFSYLGSAEPTLGPEDLLSQKERQEHWQKSDDKIKEMLSEELGHGSSKEAVEKYWSVQRELKNSVEARQRGYAGWLATSHDFLRARDDFRERWTSKINEQKSLPTLPVSLMGETPAPPQKEDREFYSDYMTFYNTWGLHSLRTWDLPVPMRPEWGQPSFNHLPSMQEAGLHLFLPWYLLRDKDLKLRELVEHHLNSINQPHLEDWLNGKPKNWGYERYAQMLKLYLYLELAIKARYGSRLKGKADKLDFALSRFFRQGQADEDAKIRGVDTVRKTRLELNKRLEQCRNR